MITYSFLQQYWWFLVSLLGALLVFMMFVQGANSMLFSLSWDEKSRRMIVNSTGRKWEITFTVLVTFGGAFFASFPLFYSTSFGGAYWVWMLILFTFVVQAVSYEFQNKLGNFLGARTFQWFLVLNGLVGPLLLGMAVSTFFNGANFMVDKGGILGSLDGVGPVVSRWVNASHGLDAVLDPWNWLFGFAVLFLARVLGTLYIINNVADESLRSRASVRLLGNLVPFLLFFLVSLGHILVMDGYAYDPATGVVGMESYKYLHNFIALWPVALLLVVGVVLFLYGTVRTVLSKTYIRGIWPAGIGSVLVVLSLLLCVGLNNTVYYPSLADIQCGLTIQNSSSSEFTLTAMSVVSLLIPFVLAYIVYVWHLMDRRKITSENLFEDDTY